MNEKEVLLSLYKQTKAKESIRAHAVLLVKSNYPVDKVAKLFYVDEDTIKNWVKEWDSRKELKDKSRPGQPKKITKEIEQEICNLVDENKPEKEGLNVSTWDCRELRIWLLNKYKIKVTNEAIRKLLKRNEFNYRKLNYKFTKADENKRSEFLNLFKELNLNKECTIVFQDEMASKLHPNKGYIWTREKKPFIETECSHEKTYLIGGVSPILGETYTTTNEKFNAITFIQFLASLLSKIIGEITLILDNHSVHHSKAVNKFLEKNTRLHLVFLPEYSPDLNPKENFWNYLRMKYLNNKVFKTTEEMSREVIKFIKSIPKDTVKSICSYEYLLRIAP